MIKASDKRNAMEGGCRSEGNYFVDVLVLTLHYAVQALKIQSSAH